MLGFAGQCFIAELPLSFLVFILHIISNVRNLLNDLLVASKLKYIREESSHKLKNINVNEAFISMEEMNEIDKELNVD